MTEQSTRPPVDEAVQASSPDSEAPMIETSGDTVPEAEARAASSDVDTGDTQKAPAQKKRIAPQAVIARLIEAWPQAFFSDPRSVKPLAIGTLQQILSSRPPALDGLNSQAIRTGIKFYTSRLSYHYGMVNNTHRITLTGDAADEVDDKAREYAKAQIAAIQQHRAAQRAAQAPQQTEQAEGQETDTGDRPARGAKRPGKRRPVSAADGADAESRRPSRGKNDRARTKGERSAKRATDVDARESAKPMPSTASEPKLTMEEKLARLAEHFGKSPS
ncbi:hypothetical protein A9404_10240 [Halothiobacillus diazotrophicus]|uniref:ProQ/FinO domain-containing protein n=1 Tax=Halothiobacillus diazotrophicus TaxID=1860122 RepID=A0A191ZIK4_9GAMM|nr:ProQ/FinO family protein [Halothiobacillus diazotrophicus]ANJ67704.1 hypothetical protein A9404_10240 [Halothiobacillus diazotrophicus]